MNMDAATRTTPSLSTPKPTPEPADVNGEPSAPPSGAATTSASATPGKTGVQTIGNNRILIVDDNPAIHDDFRKVLAGSHQPQPSLLQAEAALFGERDVPAVAPEFELHSAHQGQEALEKVKQALAADRPYALAFVDVRMPPGWDGVETISRIWRVYPELQVVICTAYSDYSWEDMLHRLGSPDNLVILKKPFDNVEVLQLAYTLTRKWELNRQAQFKMSELSEMVDQRTRELETANNELKREIRERTQAERQLRHAQKMDAIGQLAAGVAHDFNNVLTVIHGHASMLLMSLGQQSPQAKSIMEIRHSAERAANLVRQLLMFSRKQVMQFRNVELGDVVKSVSGMLRQLVGEHITLDTDCDPDLPPIYGDRGTIEQIVVNLTVNARDAMPRGGRAAIKTSLVTVDAELAKANPDARPGPCVCLEVSDTGCGMDAQALGHLFEPFFTTKEVGKGTGLGLATVYGIVRQHQGWIEVQSKVNVGTTFRIYFPVSTHAGPRLTEPKDDAPGRQGTETILLAEDEPSLREIVADLLSLQGYQVLAAGTGPDAVALWRQKSSRIDLLLTDMVMPGGMMGTDLAAQLRRDNPDLKVIFTTGYSPGISGVQDSLHEGVNFLPKPYPPNKLAEIVRKCLDGEAGGGNGAAPSTVPTRAN
jgi:two-component system, NtrC family, sensor kinase